MQQSDPIQQIIYSNVKDVVEQQKYVFESFWNRATPADLRIKEIEEGVVLGNTDIIQIPFKTRELFINLVNSAKEEVLLLLPTTNAFLRKERMGIMSILREIAIGRHVNVRILTPTNSIINKILQDLNSDKTDNLLVQPFETTLSDIQVSTVTILVADRKESLVIEKKDDSKEDILDAIGLATYSTSKPTVISYVSIFESLSQQVLLYEKLKTHENARRIY